MDHEKSMKLFRLFVIVALVISLVMNVTLMSRLGDLKNEVHSVSSYQYEVMNNINGQTSHIQNILNDFKEEQSWISRINMDINEKKLENGQTEATFDWQVKELQIDSEVFLNYAYGESSEDYTALPVKALQSGLFQVTVPLNVNLRPQWDVGITHTEYNTNTNSVSKESIQKRMERKSVSKKDVEERMERNSLKYFVSVSSGDTVKSSEVNTVHLEDIGTSQYGIIQPEVHVREENVSVTVRYHNVNESSMAVEEAYLLNYDGETFIGEESLKLEGEGEHLDPMRTRVFHSNVIEHYDGMRLVIKVVYSDGATFEKEVY